jgi:hypothetical protein
MDCGAISESSLADLPATPHPRHDHARRPGRALTLFSEKQYRTPAPLARNCRFFSCARRSTYEKLESGAARFRSARLSLAFRGVTRYDLLLEARRGDRMSEPAERMRQMRERRRKRGLRELRIVVPDSRLPSVRRRVADQVARLIPSGEAEALSWIEAVSEFDSPDPVSGR